MAGRRRERRVGEAVDRARLAALWWSDLGFDGRRERLLAWKGVITRRMRELAQLMHRENGKPVADATLEIIADDRPPRLGREARQEGPRAAVRAAVAAVREPAGPPRVPAARASSASSARGTTRCSRRWARSPTPSRPATPSCSSRRELTPGVGAWLVRHVRRRWSPSTRCSSSSPATAVRAPRWRGPASTRSPSPARQRTGKKVMAACAETLTPVLMECGGKDAMIVDADADLAAAADAAAWGGVANAGQTCVGIERVYVVDSVRDAFLEHAPRRAGRACGPAPTPRRRTARSRCPARSTSSARTSTTGWPAAARPRSAARRRSATASSHPVVLTDVPEDSPAVTRGDVRAGHRRQPGARRRRGRRAGQRLRLRPRRRGLRARSAASSSPGGCAAA